MIGGVILREKRAFSLIIVFLLFMTFKFSLNERLIENVTAENIIIYKENKQDSKETIEHLRTFYDNDDIVGILEIPSANYETIIAQSNDNSYYLNKDLFKNYDVGGTPFLDYRINNDSRKLLIYGHNSRYTDMPFKILENYYDEDFYNNNKIIKYTTEKETKTFKVFAVYTETSDWGYMQTEFKGDLDFKSHLKELSSKSIYDDSVIDSGQVLVLQTCSTKKEYLKYKKKFLLIIAGRVN